MKTLAILALMVLAGASHADELYNNGPVVNGFGRSVLMPPATTLGFGDQTSSANSVAEDFTVTGTGWTISDIDFFGYQTGKVVRLPGRDLEHRLRRCEHWRSGRVGCHLGHGWRPRRLPRDDHDAQEP